MTSAQRRRMQEVPRFDYRRVPNLAAMYDFFGEVASTTSDKLRASAGGSISLCADTSGNSNVNVLCHDGSATAPLTWSPGLSPGTGDFSITFWVSSDFVSANRRYVLWKSASAGVGVDVAGSRKLFWEITTFNVGNTALANNTWYHAAFVRESGVVSIYLNGVLDNVPFANAADLSSTFTTILAASQSAVLKYVRYYSAALSTASVVAEMGGTVQANIALNIDLSTVVGKKLVNGDTFVCSTGQTITLSSTGATGARICGARDVVNLVAASMPTLLPWSGVNYARQNGVAGGYFSTGALTAFGTGAFTISANITPASIGTLYGIFGSATNGLGLLINTNGTLVVSLRGVADGTASTGTVTAATTSIAYVKSGSTGTYYIDGSTAGTTTDNRNYSVGVTILGATDSTPAAFFNGKLNWARVYSAALSSADVAADAAGTAQANIVASFDPTRYVSGTTVSDGVTPATLWTINGGATIVTGQCAYTDGVDDFLKSAAFPLAQPVTIYLAGLKQVSWTLGDTFIDGNASNSGRCLQATSSPQIQIAASTAVATNGDFGVGVVNIVTLGFNGAVSFIGVGRKTATTGDTGTNAMNAATLGAAGSTAGNSNITVQKILIYSAAHSTETKNRIVAALARELRIPLT